MVKVERSKLRKSSILRGKSAFDIVFSSKAKVLHTPDLSFRFFVSKAMAKETSNLQIAFISPKRIAKATHRNKVRRRLKEAYRINKTILISCLKPNDTIRGVFILKTASVPFSILEKQLMELLANTAEIVEA